MRTLIVKYGLIIIYACMAISCSSSPSRALGPEGEVLVFRGTVISIENSPIPESRTNWVVRTRVDKVAKGRFDAKTFDFRVHSPSRSGLELKGQYTIEAIRTTEGYRVDQHQWNRPATKASVKRSIKWPLVDGYSDPNEIVYDKAHFEGYLAFYQNRVTSSGIGPQCVMVIGDKTVTFRSNIDSTPVGGTRFHIDHLRRFLRSRMDGTKKVYLDNRSPKLSPFERDVWHCVGFIRAAKASSALGELNKLLSDPNDAIKFATVWAIAEMGREANDSIPLLAEVLETKVSSAAGMALAKMGKAAIPALIKKARSGGVDARIYSIEALGKIGPPARDAVDVLIKALHEKKDIRDRSGYISCYAARALGLIRDKRALPHLRQMNRVKNRDVRKASRKAIQLIEK